MNKMTELEVGEGYLIYNQALVASTSSQVTFFKIVEDEETGGREWKEFHNIDKRGFLFFIRGNVRIQICTE